MWKGWCSQLKTWNQDRNPRDPSNKIKKRTLEYIDRKIFRKLARADGIQGKKNISKPGWSRSICAKIQMCDAGWVPLCCSDLAIGSTLLSWFVTLLKKSSHLSQLSNSQWPIHCTVGRACFFPVQCPIHRRSCPFSIEQQQASCNLDRTTPVAKAEGQEASVLSHDPHSLARIWFVYIFYKPLSSWALHFLLNHLESPWIRFSFSVPIELFIRLQTTTGGERGKCFCWWWWVTTASVSLW